MLPGKKLGVVDIVQALRRQAWLVCIPPAITFFAALIYSSTLPDLYQSDMLIAIDPQRVPDSFVRTTVTLETDRRLDALTVNVLSRTVLQQLIEQFDLYPVERAAMSVEDVIAKMRTSIRIDLEMPRPRWGASSQPTAFHVRFTYPDPKRAAEVAQFLGQSFVEQNVTDRGNLAGATNKFLESQLREARERLEEKERLLEVFRQRYGKELPTQATANMQALTTSQTRTQSLVESIARDRDRRMMLDRLYRDAVAEPVVRPAAAVALNSPTPQIPTDASAQEQLAAGRRSLSTLQLRYRADHPDVVRAQRLVAELEVKAAADKAQAESQGTAELTFAPASTIGDPIRRERLRQMEAEIESLDRQISFKESEEQRLRAETDEYQRRLEAVPGLESEWVSLTRDYETQQTVYKDLLSKSAAATLAANLEQQDIGERFRIVDPAVIPVNPLPAVRARINAAGLAFGLLFGLAIAAFLELKDASFRSETDVLEALSVPVLIVVPHIVTAEEEQQLRRRRLLLSSAGVACLAMVGYLTWSLRLWKSLI